MNSIEHLGWTPRYASIFEPHARMGCQPARVASEHPGLYRVLTGDGERLAVVGGRLQHTAAGRGDLPAVGDWVALSGRGSADGRAVIEAVLPRTSKFARQAPGSATGEQIVAANVDTVWLVMAANRDFNIRRLERYVSLAWSSGAQPVVVLSKADLAVDATALAADATTSAPGVPVHVLSALTGAGLAELAPYLAPGHTIALLGSSGAGKSTLFNALAGHARQTTQAVRDGDDRGRHTTTSRQLVVLPGGALAIDTPGMRELALWAADTGVSRAFEDVEAIAARCRFHDCSHLQEPGCAVQAALAKGELSAERLWSYQKLQRELAHQARREDHHLALAEKQRWKRIHVEARRNSKR